MVGLGLLEGSLRFWQIMMNVDRKMASIPTSRASIGQGHFSNSAIDTVTRTTWMKTEFIEPADAVMWSASRS